MTRPDCARAGTSLLALLTALSLCPLAQAASSSAIAQETARSVRVEGRIVQFWWLPLEYWLAAATERETPAAELETVRRLFRNYLILAVVDTAVQPDGRLVPDTHAEIAGKLAILRNGVPVELLHDVDPAMAQRVPALSYLLRASLATLGSALRIFFLSNVDDEARPQLDATRSGEITLRYTAPGSESATELRWQAPLTSLVGARSCPKGGESLEASWSYCPWHGVPLR